MREQVNFLIPLKTVRAGAQHAWTVALSRRQILGGIVGAPALAYVSPAAAQTVWWDIRFDLSKDERVLTIVEVEVTSSAEGSAPATPARRDQCRWRVPAAAFGPSAWFDMSKPAGPVTADNAPARRVVVRNATFGGRKPVTVGFILTRSRAGAASGRWHIAYETDLWLTAKGTTSEIASSPAIPFEAFLGAAPLSEVLAASRVGATMERMFDNRLVLSDPPPGAFAVTLDKHLTWRVKVKGAGGLSAFARQIVVPDLSLAWHRGERENTVFFAAQAMLRGGVDVPHELRLGDRRGHHIRIASAKPEGSTATMPLQLRVEPSPVRPGRMQAVLGLHLGSAEISVAEGAAPISGPVHAANLALSATALPVNGAPLRTVLWGDALGAPPLPRDGGAAPLATREITSPIGRLMVGAPAAEAISKSGEPKAGAEAPAPQGGTCEAAFGPTAPADCNAVSRFFQLANGDKAGAREATVFVVHDDPPGAGPGGLRRVAIDLSLMGASVAVPDVSYSQLHFERSDLRLVYEDGRTLAELPVGEYPLAPASSFVWIGPPCRAVPLRATLDLTRAHLVCARDYDLMKIGFRFHDLVLAFTPRPVIRPARDDCRVIEREGGLVEDSRPVLVAEFGPQHVMEQAIFRPQPLPLPDIELAAPIVLNGVTVQKDRDALVAHIAGLANETARADARKTIRQEKAKLEGGTTFEAFAAAFATKAADLGLPLDQRIYIGPFALDPDGMALAREVQQTEGEAAITDVLDQTLARLAAAYDELGKTDRLLPVKGDPGEPDAAHRNALRNEKLLEQLEPFYVLVRQFWRDWSVKRLAGTPGRNDRIGDRTPEDTLARWRTEYLLGPNRPAGFTYEPDAEKLFREAFVVFALGRDPIPDLVGARLSGPSRLAFRVNCQPVAGLDAEEAGLPQRTPFSAGNPGSGGARFAPLPFTFEALTDWSRHEPAVTQRARKLFTPLASGLAPPLGNRAAEVDDAKNLRFQGIVEGASTAARRLTEIRSSLARTPTALETAIEIPARLILSPAQDSVWRTNRRLPPEVLAAKSPDPIPVKPASNVGLESGRAVVAVGAPYDEIRGRLWSARLAIDDVPPSLRVVASPDLRPMALDYQPGKGRRRLPGHGAPPPGPYAPWFLGPEQMDSGSLTAKEINDSLPPDRQVSGEVCQARSPETRPRLIRWLCDRFGASEALSRVDEALFRTSLDANDRHQLVLMSSAYGLPVIGKRQGVGRNVEVAGGLVTDSGQIEPGEAFALLDTGNDQAIYRPIPLNVEELVLTSLGGSFLHDTTFKPAAGADDLWGRKIFDGFAIERWQHEIVLGRDIRAEVVYKGYLFPFGHKASLIKLTERVFLRTPSQGVKAILRQRLYLRVSKPDKAFPAVGQPHGGRMWCGRIVTLITTQTPDLIDSSVPSPGKAGPGVEHPNGRIDLKGPGLAFWPRTDLTPSGLFRFEFDIDGARSAMPLLFLDHIAATNRDVVEGVAAYYNGLEGKGRRAATFGGQKLRYAVEKKPGDTSFLTQSITVRAQGREEPGQATWTGALVLYRTTGVLEGAEQPPFYPALEVASVRLEQAERFSGGASLLMDVQYDGHYVRYGFAGDEPRVPELAPKDENPQEIFLDARTIVKIDMGANGDRAAGIARPNTRVIALGRKNGPLGGSGTVWWQAAPGGPPMFRDLDPKVSPPAGGGKEENRLDLVIDNETTLVSLASYFNNKFDAGSPAAATAPIPEPSKPQAPPVRPPAFPTGREALRNLDIVKSYFSGDAKLLGTITLKDLMSLLDIDADSLPILKETVSYGTAAARAADSAVADLATDVRTRVLSPLRGVVVRLREQWAKLDEDLVGRQDGLPGGGASKPLTLANIYPEIDAGLNEVESVLARAIATEDAVALAAGLAELYESARRLVHALETVAANPVERLQDAVGADFRRRIARIAEGLGQISLFGTRIAALLAFIAAPDRDAITNWIIDRIAPAGAATPGERDEAIETQLGDELPAVVAMPDLLAVARVILGGSIGRIEAQLDGIVTELASATRLSARDLLKELIGVAVDSVLKGEGDIEGKGRAALIAYLDRQRDTLTAAIGKAKDAVAAIARDSGDEAVTTAMTALTAELDNFDAYVRAALVGAVIRNRLEIGALLTTATRVLTIFERLRAMHLALAQGGPEEVLKAASAFARDVFGFDATAPLTDLRTRVEALAREADRVASRGVAALGLWAVVTAILVKEIDASARFRADETANAGALPILESGQPVGSIAPLTELAIGLQGLSDAATAAADARRALAMPGNRAQIVAALGETRYADLLRFASESGVLLIGDGATDRPGLSTDARRLYAHVVDLVVHLRALDTSSPAAPGELMPAFIAHWSRTARAIRGDLDGIGEVLASIVRQTERFLSRNGSVAGQSAGLAAAAAAAAAAFNPSDPTFSNIAGRASDAETRIAQALGSVVDLALRAIVSTASFSAEATGAARTAVKVAEDALKAGTGAPAEIDALSRALAAIEANLASLATVRMPTPYPARIQTLLRVKVRGNDTVEQFFGRVADLSPFCRLADALRTEEAQALAAWQGLARRIRGLPVALKAEIERRVLGTDALDGLAAAYGALRTSRDDVLGSLDGIPPLRAAARRALLAPAPGCPIADPRETLATILACDGLFTEWKVVNDLKLRRDGLAEPERQALIGVLRGWELGSAAPLVIVRQSRDIAADLLRGNVFAVIDLGAFRDQIEDAIAGLIPTRSTLTYDFRSRIRGASGNDAIFQPKPGEPFGLEVRASVDLLAVDKSEFKARGYIGAFDIKLIGGLVDALTLQFGGATFELAGGAKPRFDVSYTNFIIGRDLDFAKKLESYLLPEEGNGVFVQPLTRRAGIEAGYGINLGTLSVGGTSFFNVTLNVSAELPFDDGEALFKVSLGRRLAPFTMSVLPFAGSGYFSIYAAPDGVRGFEASFEFGGGGALRFGPLNAQARIQVGVFVRVLRVDDTDITTIYGTFFAGGSASIWIFHFATSLYVRLGSAAGGAMYGEATYTFSFSLGLADYDYSVTAMRNEAPIGSGSGKKKTGSLRAPATEPRTRFAALKRITTLSDAAPDFASSITDAADEPPTALPVPADYFDTSLLAAVETL